MKGTVLNQNNKLAVPTVPLSTYKFKSGAVKAKRVIFTPDELSKVKSHPLNPRTQEALSPESIGENYTSMVINGIHEYSLGIYAEDNETVLVIEGSSRLYTANNNELSFPIEILPFGCATNAELRKLIKEKSDKQSFSLRERGLSFEKELIELGVEENEIKTISIKTATELLGVGRETLRKCLKASRINEALILLFPHYESVHNKVYDYLDKLQQNLTKNGVDIDDFIELVNPKFDGVTLSISEMHQVVIDEIDLHLKDLLGQIDNKAPVTVDILPPKLGVYTRKKTSNDGRKVEFILNRHNQKSIDRIEQFIKDELSR